MSKSARFGTWGLAVLILLLLNTGCGGSSFVGRSYDNFTAYYNTFYNARNSFDEGVKALQRDNEPVDRRKFVSVFTGPATSANSQHFQDAIDKSADVLRGHPDSKWVDDALLLIGKSYFYQRNFVGAEQKFREVVDIGSALEDEARLWLARTLISAGAYEEARDHLLVSLNTEDLSERWSPLLHLALGQLHVKQESFEEAAEELRLGLEEVRNNDLEARGWFLLGQVLERLQQYEESVEAYDQVSGAHPRYELSYAAKLSAVRVRGLHLNADEALRELRRMERDDKNYINRFELAYVRARIYQAQGRGFEARDLYRQILYESDAPIGELRGRLHYALGELYRTERRDYVLASAHFDTAKTTLSSGSMPEGQAQVQYAPEAITDIDEKAATFASFASVRREIARMDSLLELSNMSDEDFAARILELRREKAEELAEQQRLVERRQAERGFQDAAGRSAGRDGRLSQNEDTGQAGFLFHRDPIQVQESRMNFITRWGDRPHVPDWRRLDAVAAAASDADSISDQLVEDIRTGDPSEGEAPLPPIDYSDVPRDSLSRARTYAERALARYELGNVLFLAMNRPDSAASWYRMVIEQDADEEVAQRAYYALAEVQRSLGDSAAATQIFQQVLRDYPNSDFAGRVREQLGVSGVVVSDSMTLALEDYDRAFMRWQRGRYDDALNRMVSLAASHKKTDVAPKALLAAGRIYLEWANRDSMGVFDPIPLDVADSVLDEAGLGRPPASPSQNSESGVTDRSSTSGTETAEEQDRSSGSGTEMSGGEADEPPLQADEAAIPDEQGGLLEQRTVTSDEEVGASDARTGSQAEPAGSQAESDGTGAELPATVDVASSTDGDASNQPRRRIEEMGGEAEAPPALVDVHPDSAATHATAPIADSSDVTANSAADENRASEAGESVLFAVAEDGAVYLNTLYASVKRQYPSTPYAAQADEMLAALEAMWNELHVDSTASDLPDLAAADSIAADSAGALPSEADTSAADSVTTMRPEIDSGAADSAGTLASGSGAADPGRPDSAAADSSEDRRMEPDSAAGHAEDAQSIERSSASDSEAAITPEGEPASGSDSTTTTIPEGDAAIRGEGGIRQELGGYTLVLAMNVQRQPMVAMAERYAREGFRTDVIEERVGSTTLYRAALGHFANAREAGIALQELKSSLEDGVQVAPLHGRQ